MSDPDQARKPIALEANASNNARGDAARHRRWRPARTAAWALLDGVVGPGATVAVVGAGNGDDLPLAELARRAGRVDLVDLDPRALRRARGHAPLARRRRIRTLQEDVTGGAADAIVAAALARAPAPAPPPPVPDTPVGDGPYDVVVCDLVLSQLLYPALRGGDLGGGEIDAVLLREGQRLTDAVVARLHAAAPGGTVVILHDLLGWWDGHPQPFTPHEMVFRGNRDAADALALARRGSLPYGCDPWVATRRAGASVVATRAWRWPFSERAEYVVFGLVTRR
jgi:SAM-dependent methyltransferase